MFIPAALHLLFGIGYLRAFAQRPSLNDFIGHGPGHQILEILLSVGKACDLTSDVGVTINMYYLLYHARCDGPRISRCMISVLRKVVYYTVATGLLTW